MFPTSSDYVLYILHNTPTRPSDSHLWHYSMVFDSCKSVMWISLIATVLFHQSMIDKLPAVNHEEEGKLYGKMST